MPPIWNITHLRNRNFTGREALLDGLHTTLAFGEYAALTQIMIGLGRVGKTQLALKSAYRHMDGPQIHSPLLIASSFVLD